MTWSVDPVPFFDVHDARGAGPSILESARHATRLSNGTIVVADQYARVLRFFDSSGQSIRVVGGEGRGPGEFADVMWVNQCGTDSLFVWAFSRRTMVVLDSTGAFAREYRPQGNPWEISCSSHGTFGIIGFPDQSITRSADGQSRSAPIWLADARGDSLHWLGDVPVAENRALGRVTRIATGPDAVYVGTADSAWVDVFGLDGMARGSLPIGTPSRAPTQAEYDRAIDRLTSLTASRELRERLRTTYAALPMPGQLPPYSDLRIDPRGLIWAVIPGGDAESTELRAIDTTGTVRGHLKLPIAMTVFEIGEDYVLGSYRDTSDLDHVLAYRFERK